MSFLSLLGVFSFPYIYFNDRLSYALKHGQQQWLRIVALKERFG
jgi:hypothetical protein